MRFAAVDAKAESLRLQYARKVDGEVSPPTSYATPSSVIDASGSSARSIDSAPAVVVFTSQSMVPKSGGAFASRWFRCFFIVMDYFGLLIVPVSSNLLMSPTLYPRSMMET